MSVVPRPYDFIPRFSSATPSEWADWRWHVRNSLADVDSLGEVLSLTDDERAGFEATRGSFRMAIPPYYAALMDPDDPECPVRRQSVPRLVEAAIMPAELRDPLAEELHMPVPHLVHRYPDRVLLLANNMCAMYCRFCTRKRLTGEENEAISRADFDAVLGYLRAHPEVRDVLVSGGDPWTLSDRRLGELLAGLRSVPSVEIIRFGTRMPVVLPQRVTPELVEVLRAHAPIWVMTHFNHPKELTCEAQAAIACLVDAGIPVCNQSVLLRGVNSSTRLIKDLFQRLARWRVHTYYLHQCDLALGLDSFRTPLSLGVRILRELRGHTSGYVVPHLALDLPGGGGKITLGPDYTRTAEEEAALAASEAAAVPAGTRWVTFRNYADRAYRYPDVVGVDCTCAYEEKWYAQQPGPPMDLPPPVPLPASEETAIAVFSSVRDAFA